MGIFSRLFKNTETEPETEKIIPTASESKENLKHYVSKNYVINKINEGVHDGRYYATFKGLVSNELKKELEDLGYKVRPYISDYGFQCTEISWRS